MRQRHILAAVLLLSLTVQAVAKKGLKDVLGRYFDVSVAVNTDQVNGLNPAAAKVICQHFNNVVAENCMKAEEIQPHEGQFYWNDADAFVSFAERNGMTIHGHCLVWHSQMPQWMKEGKGGKKPTREEMINRMRNHIYAVVGRYKGRIKSWDVVNEAIEDDGRMRQTPWFESIGPEYIVLAFKFAHEADPDAELYYNDYSMFKPGRRNSVCNLVRLLRDKGCRIDGVGMQSHNGLDWPESEELEASIKAFIGVGVKVSITELDLNMLPAPENFGGASVEQSYEYNKALNPYTNGVPKDVQRLMDERWTEFFRIYNKYRDNIVRVCLWGVGDGDSWHNDWPVKGRTAYPLLFDRRYKAKPVVKKIMKMFK
jgi:endo-1,4-beta-xylanase